MANFSSNINLDEIIPKGLQDENMALDMIKAGQEVLKGAIQSWSQQTQKNWGNGRIS